MKRKLLIEGMHCENCVKGLNAVLTEDLEGVEVDEISLDGKYAIIESDEDLSEDELRDAIEELGFELKGVENE